MSSCLFCRIARGEIPSKKIYEDDDVLAFHDIHPAAPVHFLLVPKLHLDSLLDAGSEHEALFGKMIGLAPRLAKELGCDNGFRVVINNGPDGGQEVFHLHIHIMGGPRPWKRL
ncbi:MAG: histidine triad nucleotide-binding protein [Burkholderiaceae bacterium]|jgi:histidine triad (HIT) family protein|nr:histidine triad nucleotide-binding protein [Burkholderiaceae bacterium]MDH5208201.1 histidine triad nucleotide-binding protein [Burkholderiaceae bacterium]